MSITDFFNLMLLTDIFIHILLSFFLPCLVNSVLFSWNSLRIYIYYIYYIYFMRRVIVFFFVRKFFLLKRKFFLLKALYFHYNRVYDYIILIVLSLIVIFIYLFSKFLNKAINKDFFFLAVFDFVETFFVEKNICNTVDYLRRKFPVLSPFIFIVFGNFKFFKCFKFFYLHIKNERKRQENLNLLIKIRAKRVDLIREMLSRCFLLGWAKYYETFAETQLEIGVFDSFFKRYADANNLENKALGYLLLRDIRLELFPFVKLIKLKKTMRLILMVSRKRRYVYDYYD